MLLLHDGISAKRGFSQREQPSCVQRIGMELLHNPYEWGRYPIQVGAIKDLFILSIIYSPFQY